MNEVQKFRDLMGLQLSIFCKETTVLNKIRVIAYECLVHWLTIQLKKVFIGKKN